MLGLINAVTATFGAIDRYVKQGLVMANRFLTPPKLSHPAQGSAEFDGSSDYIDVANLPLSSFTNFTYCTWVNPDSVSSTDRVLAFGSTTNSNTLSLIEVNSTSGGIFRFFNRDDSGTSAYADSGTISANQWYFISAVKEGTSVKIYVDGSLAATSSGSVSTFTFDNFQIGRLLSTSASGYFDGNLANVAIWNRALSSDEINAVMWKGYEALTSGEKNGLQAWYKLEESELFDASNTSTTNLEEYAKLNNLTFEGKTCLQTALDGFPDITDARLYSGKYDARVSADGGTVESLNCVETELNALL